MTVYGKYKLENVGDMEATLTMRMTVREWEQLAEQLDTKWPSWKLTALIREVTRKAKATWDHDVDFEP